MIGVNVTFQYEDSFDRARVIGVADNARATFEGMSALRFKFFTGRVRLTGEQLLRLGLERGGACVRLRRASSAGDRPSRRRTADRVH